MNQKIIHLDVFHFHFVVELGSCRYDFLTKVHKLHCDGHINLTKMTLMIHNVEIIEMKGNFDYL